MTFVAEYEDMKKVQFRQNTSHVDFAGRKKIHTRDEWTHKQSFDDVLLQKLSELFRKKRKTTILGCAEKKEITDWLMIRHRNWRLRAGREWNLQREG